MGRTNNQRKLILNKLAASGYDTERKVQQLSTGELLSIAQDLKLKVAEIKIIWDFQRAIKERRVWEFYNGGLDADKETKKEEMRDEGQRERYSSGGEKSHDNRDEGFRGGEGVCGDDDGYDSGQYRTEAGAFE